jgi:hypothetical protein
MIGPKVQAAQEQLERVRTDYNLSTGYVYGLMHLIDLASDKTPEHAMWRSRFAYRTRRYVVDKIQRARKRASAHKPSCLSHLGEQGIEDLGHALPHSAFQPLLPSTLRSKVMAHQGGGRNAQAAPVKAATADDRDEAPPRPPFQSADIKLAKTIPQTLFSDIAKAKAATVV